MSLRAIPYNRVQTTRNILFATRGGKIHSFNLSDGKHLLPTWQHPDVEKCAQAPIEKKTQPTSETAPDLAASEAGAEASDPPAKRQKTAAAAAQSSEDADGAAPDGAEQQPRTTRDAPEETSTSTSTNQGRRRGKKQSKGPSHGDGSRMGKVVDRPIITLMTCTSDGSHLIAVSGHDKAVWVFEHDGHGTLTQRSQRVMPKRPSSITLGPGPGPDIILADKFGDVYSLPLLPTPLSPSSALAPGPPKAAEPAASTLTVHSKRNLAALEHQRRQIEAERAKHARDRSPKPDAPPFQLTLLLGHVSMLTSLVVAQSLDGRRYILSADRDEHIRVSRYIPQAHITESFCLGHKEFVSEILIPLGHDDILISGGGDEHLLVWDWKAGAILSRTNLVSLAREVAPQTSRVALSGLTSLLYPSDEGPLTYVLAICEDVKAIFTWQFVDGKLLKNPSIIQLPCNPLHITTAPSSDDSPLKLIVAMDPGQNSEVKSLHEYTLTRSEGRLSSDVELPLHGQTADDAEMLVSEKDIRNMFYVVENLRKQQGGDDGQGGEDDAPAATGNGSA